MNVNDIVKISRKIKTNKLYKVSNSSKNVSNSSRSCVFFLPKWTALS